jgi:hypothetical protein
MASFDTWKLAGFLGVFGLLAMYFGAPVGTRESTPYPNQPLTLPTSSSSAMKLEDI